MFACIALKGGLVVDLKVIAIGQATVGTDAVHEDLIVIARGANVGVFAGLTAWVAVLAISIGIFESMLEDYF